MGNKPAGGKFVSKKQWKWAFASHQAWAHDIAHDTPGYKGLPAAKGGRTVKARRRG